MTRDEFLQNCWVPYPQPNAALFKEPHWIWGHVDSVSGENVILSRPGAPFLINGTAKDSLLGPSIPAALLQKGDVVGLNLNQASCFLLSPCLTQPVSVDRRWQNFLSVVREFFIEQGFCYWQTPNLVLSSGIDAHIDFFRAQGVRSGHVFSLPTSPEFALKKVLAAGEDKVFEIKPCFRDDEEGDIHRREFTMLEWYRAFDDKWTLCRDIEDLIKKVVHRMDLSGFEKLRVESASVSQLFQRHLDCDLRPQTKKEELIDVLNSRSVHWSEDDDWDDLFFRLFIEFIEPELAKNENLIAVYNFPLSQGSLARATSEGWADRFEVYWRGVELANAYQEQTNPHKVQERYDAEIKRRKNLNRITQERDDTFLNAMCSGYPPSAGIALGLDRLWMLLCNQQSLSSPKSETSDF